MEKMKSFNQQDADLLTLGQYIAKTMQINGLSKNEYYLQLANEFTAEQGNALHKFLKLLLVGSNPDAQIRLINFILDYDTSDRIISKPIEIRTCNAVCTVTVYKNFKPACDEHFPFFVSDFSAVHNTFIVINTLESSAPNAGKSLLVKITDAINAPIVIEAGFLHYGDYEVESRDDVDSGILEKLVGYYEKLGFVNINDSVGNYEDAVAMTYDKSKKCTAHPQQMEI